MPDWFTLETALALLAHERELALLDSNAVGGTCLVWDQAPIICKSLAEITCSEGHAAPSAGASWPLQIDGGALVQIDYEFPVGPWAAQSTRPGVARLWPLQRWLSWENNSAYLCAHESISLSDLQLTHAALTKQQPAAQQKNYRVTEPTAAWSFETYKTAIQTTKKYIERGDIYQANITMPFSAESSSGSGIDLEIYLHLREHSPAPYSAFFRTEGQSILSHSPECFLSARQGSCSSYPIKGTVKRIPEQDAAQRQRLYDSEKDRAELSMIIDLVRNDLGRVAKAGTVRVSEERKIIDLPYVHHALGEIHSQLDDQAEHQDILAACFPPGSITGAPKMRAMEIIDEIESQARGAYCGSFGWLGKNNECELAVAIRTMQLQQNHIRFDAGGGIVSDSTPANEWQELNDKAIAMRNAIMEQTCAVS